MAHADDPLSNRTKGRLAGAAYVGLVITGVIALLYVPMQLIDLSDPEATYANIAASPLLYRIGLVAELLCYPPIFLVLLAFLYRLFAPYGRSLALVMVLFGAASVPISFVATAHKANVVSIVDGTGSFAGLAEGARAAAVMTEIDAYRQIIDVNDVFWGLWLLPFGVLVLKTGLIPRVLGAFLVLGCFGYLGGYFGPLFIPGFKEMWISDVIGIPGSIGEIGAALWLAIFGARERAPN